MHEKFVKLLRLITKSAYVIYEWSQREQRKRDLVVAERNISEVKLNPFVYFLKKLLEQLKEIDKEDFFAEPVSLFSYKF